MERNPITDVSETRFKNVEWVSEIESTNTELLRRAREEALSERHHQSGLLMSEQFSMKVHFQSILSSGMISIV